MRKILFLFCIIFFNGIAQAQFTDDFEDGDFTSNPTWTGDALSFKVNTTYQLQLNTSGEDVAALSASHAMLQDMEWNFWIKLSFSPSDNNLARVYLSSDQVDLKGSLNGYYLKFGESGSGDAIELVKQAGTSHTVICRGTEALLASAFAVRIKVIRSSSGAWELYADSQGGVNYQLQASGIDATFAAGNYLGVYCKYTSSNCTKFFFDDFYTGQVIVDQTPPEVLMVKLTTASELKVSFSEPVEAGSSANPANYSISPGNILPESVVQDISDPSAVTLSFAQSFDPDFVYLLETTNVKDLAGNTMLSSQFPFSWHQVKSYDVLINEIMADPSPPVNLPDAEYIELYNRSAFPVDVTGWTLILGNSEKLFPDFIIPANSYVILCDDGAKPQLGIFGPVIEFGSFAVTNAGGVITVLDSEGRMIHTVSYSDDWYSSDYKKEGGWSLELIDPVNPCGEATNWIASADGTGGTPGRENSVHASNPDISLPTISRVGVNDATNVTVWFSESCDSSEMADANNYTIDNGIGKPTSVTSHFPAYRKVSLTLPGDLADGVLYTLTCTTEITDCAGNPLMVGSSAKFAIPSSAEAGNIVINELLFDPVTGSIDFVEILNRSGKVIDLKDLVLVNYDTINQVITDYNEITTEPFLFLPGTYYVLSTDSASITKFYKTDNPQGFINMATFPEMNNEEGIVAITLKGGSVIDLVSYTSAMHYPLLTSVDGVSLERISPERPSSDVTNWHSASETAGYATPAVQNSQFGMMITDENEITLSPEIFSPDNDSYNDNLAISYTFGEPGNNITIRIFDANGRPVRTLLNHDLCGTKGAFTWDGITDDRIKAPIGRYIVLVEIFDTEGNVRRYKKATILGGKL